MRRMIPQKLIDAIKSLASLAGKIEYTSGKVKVNGDFEADGITSKGIANTGALANIGDVAVSGDVVLSGKLSVGTPNYSGTFVPKQDIPEGLEWGENSYLKFEVYGNILYVVIEAQIKNTTENAITTGALSFLIESLPDSLCEKIIRRDGTNLKVNYSSLAIITQVPARRGTTTDVMVLNSYSANSMGGYFNSFSLGANSDAWLSGRLFLIL